MSFEATESQSEPFNYEAFRAKLAEKFEVKPLELFVERAKNRALSGLQSRYLVSNSAPMENKDNMF